MKANESDFPQPATLLKKRLWHRCFSVNFEKFLRTPFFIEHLRWLLLNWEIDWCIIFSIYTKVPNKRGGSIKQGGLEIWVKYNKRGGVGISGGSENG